MAAPARRASSASGSSRGSKDMGASSHAERPGPRPPARALPATRIGQNLERSAMTAIALARISNPPQKDARGSVPARTRERLTQAGIRFHANDNISRHLEPGELEALREEVQHR